MAVTFSLYIGIITFLMQRHNIVGKSTHIGHSGLLGKDFIDDGWADILNAE